MKLPAMLTPAMVDHLNGTYFQKLWNSPNEHEGANFALTKAYKRLAVGTVPLDRSVVALPTTDQVYATYRLPRHYFTNHTYFPPHRWITDRDLLQDYALAVMVYTEGGRKLPSSSVNLRYDPFKSEVVVAIAQRFTSKCTDESYPVLYATVYLDSTRDTPVVTSVYNTGYLTNGVTSANNAVRDALAHPAQSQVWVNGWCYPPAQVPTLVNGDIVEVVTDPDITSYCEINVDSNTTGYQSDLYKEYREILHIPTSLNPHQYVITTDTLLMVIFDPVTKKGVLGHRLHPHALEPISHHDFSVGRDWLNRFGEIMKADQVALRLYLRFSTAPRRLGNDRNRLADLYTLPDEEIKKQLIGTSSQQIDHWRAAYLEQSSWLKLVYSFTPFNREEIIQRFVQAMGYYDVASVLAQSVHYHTYAGAALKIQKASRLAGYPCEVMVWSNGLKLPADVIEKIRETDRVLEIGFHDQANLHHGDELVIYILTGGARTLLPWSPTSNNPTLTLKSDDYQLVQVYTYSNPQSVWGTTVTKGYRVVAPSPGDYSITSTPTGDFTYKVNASHYGNQFYLVPLAPSFTASWNIQPFIDEQAPVVISLETQVANGVVPLVGRATLEFYLNGRRLSESLDYTLCDVLGNYQDRLQYLFVLSNQSYLDLENGVNHLEMVCHTDHIVSQDTGYVISRSAYRDEPPCNWSRSSGRLFADGKILTHVNDAGNNLLINESVSDGVPFLSEWHLPYGVEKLMRALDPTDESNILVRISSAIGEFPPVYPAVVILEQLHALFSPGLCQVVHDVSKGYLVLRDEPGDERFLAQLKPYKILLDNDPVLLHHSLIDRRFVTLAAHYVNLGVTDPNQMKLVQRVISLLLDPAALSIREVLL